MKRLFYKTVREDGGSVWAIGRFRKIYKVGKRYRFPASFPAHCFLADETGATPYPTAYSDMPDVSATTQINSQKIYDTRAERAGNRVLVCYGEVKKKLVPVYEVETNWNTSLTPDMKWRYVSNDFVVIGELHPAKRDDERKFNHAQYQVRAK